MKIAKPSQELIFSIWNVSFHTHLGETRLYNFNRFSNLKFEWISMICTHSLIKSLTWLLVIWLGIFDQSSPHVNNTNNTRAICIIMSAVIKFIVLNMKNWNAVADRRDMSVTVGFIVQAEYKLFLTVSSVNGRSVRWVGRLFQTEGAAWCKTRNWWKQSWQSSHAWRRFSRGRSINVLGVVWKPSISTRYIYRDTQIVSSWLLWKLERRSWKWYV